MVDRRLHTSQLGSLTPAYLSKILDFSREYKMIFSMRLCVCLCVSYTDKVKGNCVLKDRIIFRQFENLEHLFCPQWCTFLIVTVR